MVTRVTMPQLGESVVEGTIGRWLVEEGSRVEKNQPLVEILTDKADSEIPSPVAGVITRRLAAPNATIGVGEELCEIEESADANENADENAESRSSDLPTDRPGSQHDNAGAPKAGTASPSVRKLARENNVDLSHVRGTGQGGRVTRRDVLHTVNDAKNPELPIQPKSAGQIAKASAGVEAPPLARAQSGPLGAFKLPPYAPQPGDEIIPFTRRRRIIADHMLYSKHAAPDVVTFAECDLNRTSKLRDLHKAQLKKEGVTLTFLAFAAAAVCRALREHPDLNARVLEDSYVRLREINLGIAVDTEEGLVVPVIKHADELAVRGLARAIQEVAGRARLGQLTPDDLASKTFTISNPGAKGNLVGGAIISQPNVAILRMGTIKKRVVVIEHEDEDVMTIHPVMHLALTYDHRIVDGVNANGFLFRTVEILENAEFNV